MMSTEAFEDIVETFEFLDDWEDRYRHLIEIGFLAADQQRLGLQRQQCCRAERGQEQPEIRSAHQ